MQDRIFDGLSQRFSEQIYHDNNPRGAIRLHITQTDLAPYLVNTSPKRVLDAGAGLGQMSQWLAQHGHHVTYLEPSQEMFAQAQQQIPTVLQAPMQFVPSTIQDFSTQTPEPFDFIVCHAVMEWLADPKAVLAQLCQLLVPNGYLSLMFFNQIASEFRHLLGGDLKAILANKIASNGKQGLAPISPLTPNQVLAWLPELGLQLECWSGVRCFYDYTHHEVRKRLKLDEVLVLERRYAQQEPWRSIARYQHMVLQVIA